MQASHVRRLRDDIPKWATTFKREIMRAIKAVTKDLDERIDHIRRLVEYLDIPERESKAETSQTARASSSHKSAIRRRMADPVDEKADDDEDREDDEGDDREANDEGDEDDEDDDDDDDRDAVEQEAEKEEEERAEQAATAAKQEDGSQSADGSANSAEDKMDKLTRKSEKLRERVATLENDVFSTKLEMAALKDEMNRTKDHIASMRE